MQITANNLTFEVETHGPDTGPALVLIRGLGTQLVHWPENFIAGLAAEGLRVVAFDNRDVGLSARCQAPGVPGDPDVIAARVLEGDIPAPAYTLDDMARDVIGLMDALGIGRAHVFGISMGGAIAQILAMDHGARLLSATIVMSAARPLIAPDNAAQVLPRLLMRPESPEEAQDNWVAAHASFGSPGYPMEAAAIRAEAARAWARGHDHEGVNRQLLAILAARDRRAELARVTTPCLVVHGKDDTLVPEPFGAEIAACIPGAEYEAVPGMGHIITPTLAPLIQARLMRFIRARS